MRESIPIQDRPIGVFDSGIGGLTVVRQLLTALPHESIVYFGDTARVPYGTKSPDTVTRFSRENAHFLFRRGIKGLIIACNTSSAIALGNLQRDWDLPILGVIHPGARAAARTTRNRRVGVIATTATIGSRAYEHALRELDPAIEVFGRACPLFVPLAEEGWTTGRVVEDIARTYLAPVLDSGIDTLILGCTHYPLLKDVIQAVVGEGVTLVDTAHETVVETERLFAERGQLRSATAGAAVHEYFVSDVPAQFRQVGERFLGQPIESLVWVDQNDVPWYER